MTSTETVCPPQRKCSRSSLSRSGYHRWRRATPCARACKDAQLGETLREIHQQSRGTYGRPRLLIALRRGRFRPQTTNSRHDHGVAPNRLQDQASPSAPDQVWVADITYVPTGEGWLYVAGVLDRYSRRVLGLAMSARLDTSLPEAALRQALTRRHRPRGVLHHSDRGLQYASGRYRQILRQHHCEASMSRRANCYDNAHMESFWGTLKAELLAGRHFATRAEAHLAIFEYVEVFYNRTRLHSALCYQSPVDFENKPS